MHTILPHALVIGILHVYAQNYLHKFLLGASLLPDFQKSMGGLGMGSSALCAESGTDNRVCRATYAGLSVPTTNTYPRATPDRQLSGVVVTVPNSAASCLLSGYVEQSSAARTPGTHAVL